MPGRPRFLGPARRPVVRLEYSIGAADKRAPNTLPFVIGVLADLSGEVQPASSDLGDREFIEIDDERFDAVLARIRPRLEFSVPNVIDGRGEIAVALDIEKMDHFSPAQVGARVDETSRLLRRRAELVGPHVSRSEATCADRDASAGDPLTALDRSLAGQLDSILHHPAFEKLESTWRGLQYLVAEVALGGEWPKIRVLDISKGTLQQVLRRYKGARWQECPLFLQVHEAAFRRPGGEPYGLLLGDFYFDDSPADVELLAEMSKICAAAHSLFLAGAGPSLLRMRSWRELAGPADPGRTLPSPGWLRLRECEGSRYLALAMPRFLARAPYGSETNQLTEFAYAERIGVPMHDRGVWANSAYAFAANIARAFARFGWLARISGVEGGGWVTDWRALGSTPGARSSDGLVPVETSIDGVREAQLARCGLIALAHGWGGAAFFSAPSLHRPGLYDDPDATADAQMYSDLRCLLPCWRFAQHLKCMARDLAGSPTERAEMQRALNDWLARYVDDNPTTSSEEARILRPLGSAAVEYDAPNCDRDGCSATAFLRPEFQLNQSPRSALRLKLKGLPTPAAGDRTAP